MIQAFTRLRLEDPLKAEAVTRVQDNVAKTFQSIQNALVGAWVDVPTLANGWSIFTFAGDAGSTHGGPIAVSYLLDACGFVHLRGLITGGTVSNTATGTVFTLPPGFRPYYQENFETGDARTIGVLDNGDVRVIVSAGAYAWLSGVCFRAEG